MVNQFDKIKDIIQCIDNNIENKYILKNIILIPTIFFIAHSHLDFLYSAPNTFKISKMFLYYQKFS